MPERPRRIVSLVPSQTELLFDLGIDRRVVGVTRYCVEPPQAREGAVIVGGTKRIHLDRVRELAPDLVLANKEENTAEIVAALEELAPVWVSDVRTLGDALAMIRAVGDLTDVTAPAERLARTIADAVRAIPPAPVVRAAYLVWNGPPYVAGGDTFIDHMLGRAGFQNVFGDVDRYPQVDDHEIARRRPEVLLLPDEPFPFDESHRRQMRSRHPGSAVLCIDGKTFSWYGSRLARFAEDVRRLRALMP